MYVLYDTEERGMDGYHIVRKEGLQVPYQLVPYCLLNVSYSVNHTTVFGLKLDTV